MKKYFLTLSVTLLLISSLTFAQIPIKGLVAWYPFNGNSNDYTDNNNNGIVNGATLTTDRFGNQNSAYSFNGVNNYISILNNKLPLINTSRTISVWFNSKIYPVSNTGLSNPIISYGKPSNNNGQEILLYNTNQQNIVRYAGFNNDLNNPINYTLNSWNNIVATFDGNTASIYVNNKLIGQSLFSNWNTINDTLRIGTTTIKQLYFNGSLDDIRIYNRVLNQTEITALYNENSCSNYTSKIVLPDYINSNGLVAYYPLNNDVLDYSGNQNDGVNNGAISTTDKFGYNNKAYSFKDNTSINTSLIPKSNSSYTILIDFKSDSLSSQNLSNTPNNLLNGIGNCLISSDNPGVGGFAIGVTSKGLYTMSPSAFNKIQFNFIKNTWYRVGVVFDSTGSTDYYINGQFVSSQKTPTYNNFITSNYKIGYAGASSWNLPFNGTIDNVLIWNKVLSKNEINIASNNTNCFSSISVTDTLKISHITGLNTLPDNFGLVKVYPNPAKDVLNISVSNPTASYSIQITNQLGQVLYTNTLSNSSLQVNVNSLGASGLYFIKILDLSSNVLDTRKLVLE